jgi:hypothetical protein
VSRSAKALLNLSIALTELDRNVEAQDTLTAYLADPASNPGKRAFAQSLLGTASSRVGRLRIEAEEANVEVTIDARYVGTTPLAEPVRLMAERIPWSERRERALRSRW